MARILFYLDDYSHEPWRKALLEIDSSIDFRSYPDWGTPEDGPAYAFVWFPKPGLIRQYPNIQAVFSLGAGIDHIMNDPDFPSDLPVVRMGDEGLKEGMAEYVTMSVLMHHREMHRFIAGQRQGKWLRALARAAGQVRVGIMGYGALGAYAAKALVPFGYDIAAWSRSPKPAEGHVTHYHGAESLADFLARTDILVGLLPATRETDGLINRERLSCLPAGAAVINAGRGGLIDLESLQDLLDSGHLSGATLDVFPSEPLPSDHPLWHHDKVIITPHIASITRTDSAARYVVRNIKRLEAGQQAENILNRKLGY